MGGIGFVALKTNFVLWIFDGKNWLQAVFSGLIGRYGQLATNQYLFFVNICFPVDGAEFDVVYLSCLVELCLVVVIGDNEILFLEF